MSNPGYVDWLKTTSSVPSIKVNIWNNYLRWGWYSLVYDVILQNKKAKVKHIKIQYDTYTIS
jgi:hypothetical protein